MYFRGYENVKLDDKNRIIIPASFREKLSSERLILTRATVLELPVIAVFPTEEIFQSNIANYLSLNHDEFYNRNLSLMTSEVCMDSAKKINISRYLDGRDEHDIVFGSALDLFEIWYKSDFDLYCAKQGLHL